MCIGRIELSKLYKWNTGTPRESIQLQLVQSPVIQGTHPYYVMRHYDSTYTRASTLNSHVDEATWINTCWSTGGSQKHPELIGRIYAVCTYEGDGWLGRTAILESVCQTYSMCMTRWENVLG